MTNLNERLSILGKALSELNEELVELLMEQYLSDKLSPIQVIQEMSAGMDEVGRLFTEEIYFLSELIYAGEIFKNAMEKLKPHLSVEERKSSGAVIVGTVKDDIHDIGKNIVVTMLQCAGFNVIDVGVNAPAEKFIDAVNNSGASLVGLSILLTTAFTSMHETIQAFGVAGLRTKVKIMIGGCVTNENIKEQMGADFYGRDAIEAVAIAKSVYG